MHTLIRERLENSKGVANDYFIHTRIHFFLFSMHGFLAIFLPSCIASTSAIPSVTWTYLPPLPPLNHPQPYMVLPLANLILSRQSPRDGTGVAQVKLINPAFFHAAPVRVKELVVIYLDWILAVHVPYVELPSVITTAQRHVTI
jgi:hypothetical protein